MFDNFDLFGRQPIWIVLVNSFFRSYTFQWFSLHLSIIIVEIELTRLQPWQKIGQNRARKPTLPHVIV